METDSTEHLDSGDAKDYVNERLFSDCIDNIDMHIRRKKALADKTRYTILYLLYEYGELSRRRLSEETDRTGDSLQQHVEKLLDNNLIARRVTHNGGRRTYYRITHTGEQIIASDIDNVASRLDSESARGRLKDSYLDPDESEGRKTTES